jgi:hypothetical protein
MTSPYLDQPLIPLAVALPRMLEKIEGDMKDDTLCAEEKWQLRCRAGLVHRLLTASQHAGGEAARTPV